MKMRVKVCCGRRWKREWYPALSATEGDQLASPEPRGSLKAAISLSWHLLSLPRTISDQDLSDSDGCGWSLAGRLRLEDLATNVGLKDLELLIMFHPI